MSPKDPKPAEGWESLAEDAAAGALSPSPELEEALREAEAAVEARESGQPAVRQEWGRQGATPMVMTPAVFEKYIQDDIAKWARVIKSANIKAE